jgi:glucose/arabinose dehydrogenase
VRSVTGSALLLAAALGGLVAAGAAVAQEKEEEPFWAVGRPKTEEAAGMAPVAAPPIPTPADELPALEAPPGFTVETFASRVLDARGLREGDRGTVFVSSLFVAGNIYALVDKGATREVRTIAEKLTLPNGIEYHEGARYVAMPKEIWRYDDIEANLGAPPQPAKVYDALPGDVPHGWKLIMVGPDGKLYVPVGAPCNICEPDERYAKIDAGEHRV